MKRPLPGGASLGIKLSGQVQMGSPVEMALRFTTNLRCSAAMSLKRAFENETQFIQMMSGLQYMLKLEETISLNRN